MKTWKNFGKSIKLGCIDDRSNKNKLVKLLRYATSKSDGKLIGFEEYVERMKEDQKSIYYITGESVAQVQNSPFLERLKKKDLEVIYMVDALDEYVVQNLAEFDGNTLQSVAKEGLKLGDEDEVEIETLKTEYKPLCEQLKKIYGNKVEKVIVGTRIAESPAVLVTSQYGWSANMERIMKAQTFGDTDKHAYMAGRRTMEINPQHPLIKAFLSKLSSDGDQGYDDMANLLYDAALVSSGFQIETQAEFAARIHRVISHGFGVETPSTETASHDKDEL